MLGALEIEIDGGPLRLTRRRERCLLGVLLLEANTVVPTRRLVDLLWDGAPPPSARAGVQVHISRLRALLAARDDGTAGVGLERQADGYVARTDPARVDAHRFQALVARANSIAQQPRVQARLLRQALGMWRGPLLANEASDLLRSRISVPWREMRLSAIESVVEAELSCGRAREVIGELATLTEQHFHRERFHELLMLALYRCGRQAEALEVYRTTRARLRADLGIEPGPGLRSLHQQILTGDPALGSPGGGPHPRVASPGHRHTLSSRRSTSSRAARRTWRS